jgi:N4-gp56 family major capsid protein
MAIYGNDLGSGLGVERQALIDKQLLKNMVENMSFDKYATMQKPLPLKNSKVLEFEKWIRMMDLYLVNNINADFTGNDVNLGEETYQYTPDNEYQNFVLSEGSSGASKAQMKLIKTSTTVFPIGDWMPYTEELTMFHNRWTVNETTKQMGAMSGKIIDGYYRDLYRYGAGHIKDISGDADGSNSVADQAFADAANKMYDALKLSGAAPVNEIMTSSPNYATVPVTAKFTGVIHTIAASTMRQNPSFTPIEKYAAGVTPIPGEIGILGHSIRVIENENAPLAATGTPNEYTCEMLVFGAEHTAHVPIRGQGSSSFVFQPIGSSGTADPLKRVGSIGWKSWLGAKVLFPERLGLIKALVKY